MVFQMGASAKFQLMMPLLLMLTKQAQSKQANQLPSKRLTAISLLNQEEQHPVSMKKANQHSPQKSRIRTLNRGSTKRSQLITLLMTLHSQIPFLIRLYLLPAISKGSMLQTRYLAHPQHSSITRTNSLKNSNQLPGTHPANLQISESSMNHHSKAMRL